ncbi:MAG: sensor histidine kinase [Bacteroidia bacterium]
MGIFNISIKANHIRGLVVAIALSLLTLLGLQFYWLQNAMKLQRDNFNILANNAIQEISKRLESQEAMGAFMRASLRSPIGQPLSPPGRGNSLSDFLSPDGHVQPEPGMGFAPKRPTQLDPDSVNNYIDNLLSEQKLMGNRAFMLEFMREIQENRSKNIHDRIHGEQLDSMVEIVFRKYELQTDYVYEIVKADNEFFKRVANENKLAGTQNVFLTRLYPGDYFSSNHYLVFRFQNQRAFFFSNVSAQIIISLLAILLLGLSFYMLVDLLVRQKKLSEMKTDFINNMTHELKTPIATISLASEALIELHPESVQGATNKYSKVIFDENTRLKRHVERILNIALLERACSSLNRKVIDMHELLRKVAAQSELVFEKRNAQLALRLMANTSVLPIDEMHMSNVITNLLDNALKYCKNKPDIAIETKSNHEFFTVSVRDNGIGMTSAQVKKIFDKFYRVPTGDVHDVKGFGLGLSYVQSIVGLHGGKVEVSSEPGNGSIFSIKLPLNKIQP